MINDHTRIYIAGHKGLVGSALLRAFKKNGFKKLIYESKNSLDLRVQSKVKNFFYRKKPEVVIIAAAKVGGIFANEKYPANFIYDNLAIQNNIIHESYKNKVKNLIFLGSSCIYPRNCKQPIKENYLLEGRLEKTNEAYAIAKIAGVKLCEYYNKQYKLNYKCLMPTNLYGPNDDYDLNNSHFLPALIRKIYEAKKNKKKFINIWGSGKAKRELLFVDDLADACIFFFKKKTKETLINIGSGEEKSIIEYAKILSKYIYPSIKFKFDKSKPEGTPKKLLNNKLSKKYGWKSKITLEEGIKITYKDFLKKNKI